MSEASDEEDRRVAERRGEERREFRRESGRRDDVVVERRGRPRRRAFVVGVVGLMIVGFVGWRSVVVGPARLAEAESAQARTVVEAILAEVSLPLLAPPGFGDPGPGDPAHEPLLDHLSKAHRDELERVERRLAPALSAAPRVAGVPEVLAPIRFLLGREREARLAWEAMLRLGDERQEGRARVGLAVMAIRAGLRATEEQDAGFAFDHARTHLERVGPDHPDAAAAAFGLGLIEVLQATGPNAEPALTALRERGRPEWVALLTSPSARAVPRRWTETPEAPTIESP